MFDKILVAIDGSSSSEKALAVATDLAQHYRAELVAIGVAEVPEVVGMMDEVDELRRGAEAHFRLLGEAAVAFAQCRGVSLRSVVVLTIGGTRGVAEPASPRGTDGSRNVDAMPAEHSQPARTKDDQSISANGHEVGGVGGHRRTNEGNQ